MKFFFNLFRKFRDRLFFALLAIAILALFPAAGFGQFKFREPPNRQNPDALKEREGTYVWQQFLRNRNIGSFQIEGRLTYRPSGAASKSYAFQLKGTWLRGEERTQLSLSLPNGRSFSQEVLVAGTEAFRVGNDSANACMAPLGNDELNATLFDGLPFNWTDVLMPFLYWEEVSYVGPDRYLGRPAHRFALMNPEAGAFPSKVIVTLDEDYAALLKVDLFAQDNELVKRIRVGGFKQFGNEWMFSELYWDHRPSRESVRLDVQSFTLLP